MRSFKSFKPFKRFKPPPYILPRVAGEERGGGLNGAQRLNVLNVLNLRVDDKKANKEPRMIIGAVLVCPITT